MLFYNITNILSFINALISSMNIYPLIMDNIWSKSNNYISISVYSFSEEDILNANNINNDKFPEPFFFGSASSAYQVEGAYNEHGKGPSMWDIYTHIQRNDIIDGSNGDIATNSYYFYEKDVLLAEELNGNAYKFSIAWSRILPKGTVNNINFDGIQYYNRLINAIIVSNMTPIVSMYQYDYPYELHLLGGWTNPESIVWFTEYAKLLFQLFGDRVKHWITFNRPEEMCSKGYGGIRGTINSGTEDYLCGHNVLLAHANVFYIYDQHYRNYQSGYVGIVLNMNWYDPLNVYSDEDYDAAKRAFVFKNEWLLQPLMNGDYPELMKARINGISSGGNSKKLRLPSLDEYGDFIKGKVDFIGIDYFTTIKTTESSLSSSLDTNIYDVTNCNTDLQVSFVRLKNESLIKDTPEGLSKVLEYINSKYDLPMIYITGNGFSDDGSLNDVKRVKYIYNHLKEILNLIRDGIDIRGYFVWSLLDSFEWTYGYTAKYGLYSVDFNDEYRKRKPKLSSIAVRKIFGKRKLISLDELLN